MLLCSFYQKSPDNGGVDLPTDPPNQAWWLTVPGRSAHRPAAQAQGYRLVLPPESFLVQHTEGPLREEEEEPAWLWGAEVAPQATEDSTEITSPFGSVVVSVLDRLLSGLALEAAKKPHAVYKPVEARGNCDVQVMLLTSTFMNSCRSSPSQEPDS